MVKIKKELLSLDKEVITKTWETLRLTESLKCRTFFIGNKKIETKLFITQDGSDFPVFLLNDEFFKEVLNKKDPFLENLFNQYYVENIEKLTEINMDNVVFIDHCNEIIKDLNGKILPYVMFDNYSMFNNNRFDIDPLLEHLKSHTYTVSAEKIHRRQYDETDPSEEIKYSFLLPAELTNQIVEELKSYGKSINSLSIKNYVLGQPWLKYRDKDILGIDKFRKSEEDE